MGPARPQRKSISDVGKSGQNEPSYNQGMETGGYMQLALSPYYALICCGEGAVLKSSDRHGSYRLSFASIIWVWQPSKTGYPCFGQQQTPDALGPCLFAISSFFEV